MARKNEKTNGRGILLFIIGISAYFSLDVFAQTSGAETLNIDATYVFRGIVTSLLAGVAWYVNRLEKNIEKLDNKIIVLEKEVPRDLGKKIDFLDNQDRQALSLLMILKDQVNREHTTKHETTEHRRTMEDGLRELRNEFRNYNEKNNLNIQRISDAFLTLSSSHSYQKDNAAILRDQANR